MWAHLRATGHVRNSELADLDMHDAPSALYQKGALALKQASYEEAIACLEQFCKETVDRQSKPFFQAQMWLIQAYHKDRKDLHAIALCEQLVKSDIPQVKQWADKALDKLMATTDSVTSAPRPTATPPPADTSPPINQSTPSLPVETPPTGQFTDAVNPLPKPAVARSTGSQSRSPKKSPPKDYTQQIMSAIAHGSISMLASFLIYLLFSDSVFANGLGLLRFGVPLLIFFTTPDNVVKGNAREALNYCITCLILLIPLGFAFLGLALIFAVLPPLGLLLGVALGGYLIALSFYPAVGTVLCLMKEDYEFRYPDWLILHVI